MSYKLNEAETKNLMWILMHGGEVRFSEWRAWRRSAPGLLGTELRKNGFLASDAGRTRVFITEKGRKAIEEIS